MVLDKINSPEELKKLNKNELNILADEIRQVLIKKITKVGGHIGSNLGIVEATIALHYVFNSPVDKFVFDVSHQSYVHKILTGRKEYYLSDSDTLGISGYTTPKESEHDIFKVGHTSSSVSLALGLAKAKELNKTNENIVAIIGDGSLSGGMAFEGLDNAALLKTGFIILVNDNEMSIAVNQGGLYQNLKELRETNGKAQNNYFKNLGLDYRYLEDGNNVQKLIELFESVKGIDHPIVLHIHTLKGKGLKWAESTEEGHFAIPEKYKNMPQELSVQDLTTNKFRTYLDRGENIVVVTAATPTALGLTQEFRDYAKERFIDCGITEEHTVAYISGLARAGVKPIFVVNTTFLQRAYDQLNQDLGMNNNPAVIITFKGGASGGDTTHSGQFDLPLTSNIPNLICLAPQTRNEYEALLDFSIHYKKHPLLIKTPNDLIDGEDVSFNDENIFKSIKLKDGKDVAIYPLGQMLDLGKKVIDALKEKGINASLYNPLNFSDIDKDNLDEVSKTHKIIVTIENNILDGGYGQKVASYLGNRNIKVLNYGLNRSFYDQISLNEIYKSCRMTKEDIVEDILKEYGL